MNAVFWFAAAWLSIPTQADTPPGLLRFKVSFDRTCEAAFASGARAPRLAENVTFVPGKFGQAVFFGKQTHLDYAAQGNLDKQQGTVCMWVRPNWSGADGKNHGFFSDSLNFGDLSSNNLYLWKWSGGLLRFDMRQDPSTYVVYDVRAWRPGQWRHIAAAWDAQRGVTLFVDGKPVAKKSFVWKPRQAASLRVGTNWNGTAPAEAAIDDLRVYSIALNAAQVATVMAARPLERVVYEKLAAPQQIRPGAPFDFTLRVRPARTLARPYPVRLALDGLDLGTFQCPRVAAGKPTELGPFSAVIPKHLYVQPGPHKLHAELSGAVGAQVENATITVRVMPMAPPQAARFDISQTGRVLRNGEPFLPRQTNAGFIYKNHFHPVSAESEKLAADLVRTGQIVDAVRVRRLDSVDCTGTDHEFKEWGRSRVVELTPGRRFRIPGPPDTVRESGIRRGRKFKVLPAFSYRLKTAPRPTPHILVLESINDIERNIEIAVDAAPGSTPAPHLASSGIGNPKLVNLVVVCTGRHYPTDAKPFQHAVMFFPKTDRVEVTISSSGRELQRTATTGAAVSRMTMYEVIDPIRDLANAVSLPPKSPRRTLALFYPHAPLMFEEYGFSGASKSLRRSSVALMMDYLKLIGFNRLEFHPYAFGPRAYFPSEVFPHQGQMDVFDDVLPIARREDIDVLPRVDSLVFFDKVLDDDAENFQQGRDGKIRRCFGKVPDPLRPRVQKLLLDVLRDMLDRTKGYDNVPGVGFRANAKFGSLFVGSHWRAPPQEAGYSKWDVALFEKDTGIKVEANPDDHQHRYEWLRAHAWEKWIDWRCRKMHAWWCEARDLVRSYGQDKKLFVKTIIPYDHHFPSAETQWYGRHVDPLLIHKYHGYDPALYRDETGMVVERYIPIGADRYNRGRVHNYPWWHVPSLTTFYRTREGTAVELYFIYWELSTHPKGFRVGPEGAAGRGFFEPLTFAVRTMNPYAFTFYNWHRATLGRELQLREFARAFRGLPAVAPRPFDGRVKPAPDERLWVRWLGNRLAIVNDRPSPQDIELDIPKPLPAGWRVRELATNTTPVPPSPQARSSTTVSLHMRAYDLQVLSFEK